MIKQANDLYLCLDQGGHASRAIVFDGRGEMHASAFSEIETLRSGRRVEHDPEQIIASLRSAAREAVAGLGASARNLVAAGIATQRSSIVCWERDSSRALSPVISWQDTRASAWLAEYRASQERVHKITGLVLSPHYGVSKLRWCLNNLDEVLAAQESGNLAFGPLASYIVHRLAEEAPVLADPANASRTLLWDRRAADWSDELLKLFGISRDCLPKSVASKYGWGHLRIDDRLLPIQIVTGDQSAALFAFGAADAQTVYANLGTGAFLQRNAGGRDIDPHKLLASVVYRDESSAIQVIEATVNGAGSAINALAAELGVDKAALRQNSAGWLDAYAGEPLFLNAVSGLGSPWWLADQRSAFSDDSPASDANKLAAVMESIAFLLAVNLEQMTTLLGEPARMLVTGGLASVDPLLQRIATLAGVTVERTMVAEATARGLACLLAGLPADWPGPRTDALFAPLSDQALLVRYRRWRKLMPPV
jgi:glycerol kinase